VRVLKTPSAVAAVVFSAALVCSTGTLAQDAGKEPTVEDTLKKVDEALFFYDRQEKLQGYDVEIVSVQAMAKPGQPAAEPKVEKGAKADKISFDATTGKKKQTDASGADLTPTSFTPGCGPWTLTSLMAFEIDLFAQPFSSRFDAANYDREVETIDGGSRLKLTPKQPIGEAFMLKPAITGLELDLDKDAVPTRATLHLDQKMMKEDGALVFHFVDMKAKGKEKAKKRIDKIENSITSANLKITPTLTFRFSDKGDKSGAILPKLIEFRVPGGELSGTLAGQDMITFLVFTNLKTKQAKK
jgi:hypothetical protein